MRQRQFRCSASSVQRQAEQWVVSVLGLVDPGKNVSRWLLARLLILAASLKGSLSGVQHGSRQGVSAETVRMFYTYASAVIVDRGHRWTIALVPVNRNDALEAILESLLDQIAQSGLKMRLVLLDRGFYSAPIIHLLQQRKLNFLMPMIRRGRDDKQTGTQPFFRRGTKGFFAHQWRWRGKRGPLVEVQVVCVPRAKGSPHVYAFHGRRWSLAWIQKTYRKRFGIETKYRQLGESLAKTTSHNQSYRLLLVGLALLLRNVWVWCQTQMPENQHPVFYRLLDWLRLALIKTLGVITELPSEPQAQPGVPHSP